MVKLLSNSFTQEKKQGLQVKDIHLLHLIFLPILPVQNLQPVVRALASTVR